MSFQDVGRGGGAAAGAAAAPAAVPASEAGSAIARSVFMLTTQVRGFARGVVSLGGPKDTPEYRHTLRHTSDHLSKAAKDLSQALHALPPDALPPPSRDKLLRDFQAALAELQRAQKQCVERELAYAPRAPPPPPAQAVRTSLDEAAPAERQALLQEQKQRQQEVMQLGSAIEYNTALIEERDAGIQDIQQQIGEVHEIFQDLAVLVNEQGHQIDDIESNIVTVHEHTRQANQELAKASKSQRKSRGMACCILSAVVILVVILILFIGS
eukprot:jgi/Chlat1/147/Chrsp1S03232